MTTRRIATLTALLMLGACGSKPTSPTPSSGASSGRPALTEHSHVPAVLRGKAAVEPEVTTYAIHIDIQTEGGRITYDSALIDVRLGDDYQAEIAYLGPDDGTATSIAAATAKPPIDLSGAAGGIGALVHDNPAALIMNGGFYGSDPLQPVGLLLVKGRVQKPFAFGRGSGGTIKLNALLCITDAGRISFLHVADFQGKASVTERCRSALQSTPWVLEHGQSLITPQEPARKPAALRSMLGIDADGVLHALFFTQPIHLGVAAAVLSAPQADGERLLHVAGVVVRGIAADHGLGLSDVVNLDGDTDSTAVYRGQTLTGDPGRDLPSAVVILPHSGQ